MVIIMKKILLLLIIVTTITPAFGEYVKGYYRYDGTYVQGHYRSKPNSNKFDNYSTKGNYNPYNNKKGSVDPYRYNYSSANYNARKKLARKLAKKIKNNNKRR